MGPVRVAGLPDGEVGEQVGEVLAALLEEVPQHGQVQRLAEPARSGELDDLGALVEHLADQVRLVDVREPLLAEPSEVVDADTDAPHDRTLPPEVESGKRTARAPHRQPCLLGPEGDGGGGVV